jgi:cytoskeletal protein CcmA (bactofilin family)
MAIWDKSEPPSTNNPTASTPPSQPSAPAASQPAKPATPQTRAVDGKESFIASGLTIEGKINGKGSVRVAGKFKGDIQVEGDLHIDREARVEGLLKAGEVVVNGELQGNIDSARRVELKQGSTMTGDLKAGSLTVEAGARMRGNVDFGFEEGKK